MDYGQHLGLVNMVRMAFGFGVHGKSGPVLDTAFLALIQQYDNLISLHLHVWYNITGIHFVHFLSLSLFFFFAL